MLQGALQQMAQEQVPGARPARVHILNPKSIDLGELYGSYNVMTNEWKDGLASGIIRTAAAAEEGNLWEWVVFDGPVDTLWTESLNTGEITGPAHVQPAAKHKGLPALHSW